MPNDCQNKPKLNQSDIETTTTTCTSCNKYPRKNYRLNQSDIEKLDFSGVEEMEKKNFEFLQKLGIPLEYKIDPIEEVKKEWEDDGFKFSEILCYELINTKQKIKIYIYADQKEPWCAIDGCLTLKQLTRLTKTLMALEKKDVNIPLKIENINTQPTPTLTQRFKKMEQEEKIFKQFKELGYEIDYKMEERRKKIEGECKWLVYNEKVIHLTRDFCQKHECAEIITYDKEIIIYTDSKKYRIVDRGNGINITIQEHQLLHKLFELWGWFDE